MTDLELLKLSAETCERQITVPTGSLLQSAFAAWWDHGYDWGGSLQAACLSAFKAGAVAALIEQPQREKVASAMDLRGSASPTAGAPVVPVEQMRISSGSPEAADCRACTHFMGLGNPCRSTVRCIDADQFKPTRQVAMWLIREE